MKRSLFLVLAMLLVAVNVSAYQRFVHLTSKDVRIDSIIPTVGYILPLPGNVSDSVYTVSVVYPEFMDMSEEDVAAYNRLSSNTLPEIPTADMYIAYDRKKAVMYIKVVPMALNEGSYKWVTSFMLRIESNPKRSRSLKSSGSDYASHSVLASGKWAKIRVDHTGIFELTQALASKAGFSDISKVKVYGYGGNLQPEAIQTDYLKETDDLKEVPQYTAGGKHLFYGKGPVSWSSATATSRTRNPYSDYGYYFLTEGTPTALDAEAFKAQFYHAAEDYHDLYEVDDYAYYHGGRNLYDSEQLTAGTSKDYVFKNNSGSSQATFTVSVSASSASTVAVSINGNSAGAMAISLKSYDKGSVVTKSYTVDNLASDQNTVTIKVNTGTDVHLDNIAVTYNSPYENYALDAESYSVPEYVGSVENQDLHADEPVDIVVIIPESQQTLAEAQILMTYHEKVDGLSYRIVPANQLYNEFSSGTPDANAYRRYLRMLYDRSQKDNLSPKYLLLYGNGVWDNRMLTSTTAKLQPEDYLLCFESENSTNEVNCYVDDGWFTLLDDGEGLNPQSKDKQDVAVGRFPVTTLDEAKILTDKTLSYMENAGAGKWQNTLVFMGDDGNNNLHMTDADEVAENVLNLYPGYNVKKVMWDTFERETTASGNTYPTLTKLLKQYQRDGVLIMDYSGHGSPTQLSHEQALHINDFKAFENTVYPLWITASCDIMPFDSYEDNIGVTALMNENGGTCAFFGTTRTVYANYNRQINKAFTTYVLSKTDDGEAITLGEAQRQAKNYLIESGLDTSLNKLQFSLLGDPAMSLVQPQYNIVIDSINGVNVANTTEEDPQVKAGGKMHIRGHVDADSFNGNVSLTVYDSKQTVVCRKNDSETSTAFTYKDRSNILFNGDAEVSNSVFDITFTVPLDINYSNEAGRIVAFAVNEAETMTAHGSSERFIVGGTDESSWEQHGPSVFCYLNKSSFKDGDKVNASPMFFAKISDESGINVTGSSVGHDLTLIVDGSMSQTYILNDNFSYTENSQTTGIAYYGLSNLSAGEHSLQFRAWDLYNNPTTSTLRFVVDPTLAPEIVSLTSTNNPVYESTKFIIAHDRIGVVLTTRLDIMDMSGRMLWQSTAAKTYDDNTAVIDWDLSMADGSRLQTGVYLYRVTLSTEGSEYSSKAKKLIVINKK